FARRSSRLQSRSVVDPGSLSMRSRPSTGLDLDRLIRRDQLDAVRASVQQALPINMLLGLASFLVALHSGHGVVGGLWFTAAMAVNLMRLAVCRAPCAGLAMSPDQSPVSREAASRSIDRHLRLACLAALLSGSVWA